jgi:hypothetical protein
MRIAFKDISQHVGYNPSQADVDILEVLSLQPVFTLCLAHASLIKFSLTRVNVPAV